MKLAVSTYSLSQWRAQNNKSLEQSVDKIAELGAAGVEFLNFAQPGESRRDALKRAVRLRKRAESKGLSVVGYCVGAELLVKPALQRQAIDTLKHEVDVARELGVRSMRHDVTRGFGKDAPAGPRTFAAALRTVVPAIREVTEYAQRQGVITTFENHGFYMQAPDRVEKLIRTVGHPNFRLTLDMGNFLCVNADPVAAVKRLARYAVLVHAKDFHLKRKGPSLPKAGWFNTPTPIALRGAIVGHGVIDVPAQLKLLRRSGYDGWLSLEFEGMEEPVKAVKLGLDYLREHLQA